MYIYIYTYLRIYIYIYIYVYIYIYIERERGRDVYTCAFHHTRGSGPGMPPCTTKASGRGTRSYFDLIVIIIIIVIYSNNHSYRYCHDKIYCGSISISMSVTFCWSPAVSAFLQGVRLFRSGLSGKKRSSQGGLLSSPSPRLTRSCR